MKFNKSIIAIALSVCALSSTSAFASSVSDIGHGTGAITFTAGVYPVTVTITPEPTLSDGSHADKQKVATVEVTKQLNDPDINHEFVVKWNSNTGTQVVDQTDESIATVSQTGNASNKITLKIDGVNPVPAINAGNTETWYALASPTPGAFSAGIIMSGQQTVVAGDYSITIDGAVYTA